jgi:hypothetical protein
MLQNNPQSHTQVQYYAALAVMMVAWLIGVVKENAQTRYYWIGRRDGWDMHRRMIDNKVKTDQVFDYDKN